MGESPCPYTITVTSGGQRSPEDSAVAKPVSIFQKEKSLSKKRVGLLGKWILGVKVSKHLGSAGSERCWG